MNVTLITYFFATSTVVAALGILFSKNVFKAALLLLVTLLCVAALFVLSAAEFVAVTQILIYAGGVMVLIIFSIMLTTSMSGKPMVVSHANLISGGALGVVTIAMITKAVLQQDIADAQLLSTPPEIHNIGLRLMTTYSLPFELSGILLLVALIGASVLISFLKDKKA